LLFKNKMKQKLGKDDYGFVINGETGNLEMSLPKKEEYTIKELSIVLAGLEKFKKAFKILVENGE